MTKEPNLLDIIQKWNQVIQKLIRIINKNKIPNDYHGLKQMKERLEQEEDKRNEMNRLRESVKHLIKKRRQREHWAKIERCRKIRAFLHLPYKTLNEDDFMRDFDQ